MIHVIEQSHEILSLDQHANEQIELAARTCYKSEDRITPDSAQRLVRNLIERGHMAMVEFADATVKFITNRGVTHELVRHRLCAFAQESTRYVNYGKRSMQFIRPVWWNEWGEKEQDLWRLTMEQAASRYAQMIELKIQPQKAREILPNSLKTEINVKANLREWRHIFQLRCAKAAHPQMRALMIPVLQEFAQRVPVVFDDILADFS